MPDDSPNRAACSVCPHRTHRASSGGDGAWRATLRRVVLIVGLASGLVAAGCASTGSSTSEESLPDWSTKPGTPAKPATKPTPKPAPKATAKTPPKPKKPVFDPVRHAIMVHDAHLLGNHKIRWDADSHGLLARYDDEVDRLIRYDGPLEPELCKMLEQPDQFVVAHVILTERRLIRGMYYEVTGTNYGGLNVILHRDGSTEIDPAQIPRLRLYWAARTVH